MKLTKRIPARSKTIHVLSVARDFMQFGVFRKARERTRLSAIMTHCKWCNHPFKDDEMMQLAFPVKGKNIALCNTCADELERSE